jgi:phytoene dehydrogenase-like protein
MVCEGLGERVCLYRDVDKLRSHLCGLSTEDIPQIRQLCRDIARFSTFSMPVMDIPGLKVSKKSPSIIKAGFKMLPALLRVAALSKISVADYVMRFKHPAIRLLLSSVVRPNFDAVALLVTLGCFAAGDGGYVKGGSLKLVANMARCFKNSGGLIHYSRKVERVQVVDGKACGVVVGGELIPACGVVVTADTLQTIDSLFLRPIYEKWALNMRANTKKRGALIACTFISIGVEVDLQGSPESVVFPLKTPFEFAGGMITSLDYNQYAEHSSYAPLGCTALTIILSGDTYQYWKQKREQGIYDKCKAELFELIRTALEEHLPSIVGKIAVWDIATPLTYERYCGTYHGSWMTTTLPRTKRVTYPCKPKTIANLYFAGQRIMPPGGIPVAVSTGRTAAQHLCRDFDTVFRS